MRGVVLFKVWGSRKAMSNFLASMTTPHIAVAQDISYQQQDRPSLGFLGRPAYHSKSSGSN